jgi:hypothetical protein
MSSTRWHAGSKGLKKQHEYIDSVRRYELIVNISNISSKTTLKLSHIDCSLVAKLLCNIWFRKILSYTPDSLKIKDSCNTNNFGICILAKVIRLTDKVSKNCLIPISCWRILKLVSIFIRIQSIYFKILLRFFYKLQSKNNYFGHNSECQWLPIIGIEHVFRFNRVKLFLYIYFSFCSSVILTWYSTLWCSSLHIFFCEITFLHSINIFPSVYHEYFCNILLPNLYITVDYAMTKRDIVYVRNIIVK